ncbi:DUF952 domain-containing protein [Paralimibaculum aggregatum]|uniref:DUF952 domain-containing protein n=1 Tax=Paralimibaculum aggregatum TaxID=3036245 RepID=A0ABQ6LQV7_9RHOB|nr:DUF952 domain-containing protein [Limibaculum sp. NKW23]GMG84088.1 DUF952 domain-containing protein [Limibaculum sp. NKW23]
MTEIFKILTEDEHDELRRLGAFQGSAADIADGFIHFSTAAQLPGTAAKHFAGQDGLWLLAVPVAAVEAALEWEPARGGDLFPHLYGALRAEAVARAEPLPLGPDGRHAIPGWASARDGTA